MLHLVALALRRQVCGIRTLVTSVLSAAVLCAGASAPVAAQPQAPIRMEAARPPEPAAATTPPAPQALPPAAAPQPPTPGRRLVAVLLPLESPVFGRAAAHVRNGLSAAWAQSPRKGQVELRFIPVGDQPSDVIAAYNAALAAGAQAIVGPLIRDQVIALANGLAQSAPVSVPTMALNIVEGVPRLVPNLFLFGLSTESEARQVARLALREGHKRALVLTQPTAFSRRLQQAFIEAFTDNGGSIAAQHAAVTDLAAMNRMRAASANIGADMIFIAADLVTARTVRPFLDTQLPTYATSQLWSGPIDPNANLDLNGTRLLDMPWLLEPDHAAVMVFPRSQPALPPENERLYALGIDAYRLAEMAIERGIQPGLSLDGVTGRITLERSNWLVREPVPAQVWQGQIVPGTERR
ncbi:MAG: penicillin-binding protein activator [bacterium]|jgi:hypothetical protein|nr:penicillin-binding protein activator [Betaproteobacteria bacterium]